MKCLLTLAVLLCASLAAQADTIEFPTPSFTVNQNETLSIFSSGLNGIGFNGQSESLDLLLNGASARLDVENAAVLEVGLEIYTNAGTFPGFLSAATSGYLIDTDGVHLSPAGGIGRADGSDGSTEAGLFFFAPLQDTITGIHLDTTFPDDGATVTNARLLFVLVNAPEPATFGLLLTGLALLGLAKAKPELERRRS